MNLQEKRNRVHELLRKCRELAANDSASEDELRQGSAWLAEITKLKGEVEQGEAAALRAFNNGTFTGDWADLPGGTISRAQSGEGFRTGGDAPESRLLKPDEKFAQRSIDPTGVPANELDFGRYIRGLVTGNWRQADAERRAMSVGSDVAGGYLVPETLADRVIDLARNKAVLLRAGARTLEMTTPTVALAKVTGGVTAQWLGENAEGTSSDASFGQVNLFSRTLAAYTKMSIELVEDAPNFSELIQSEMGSALSLELDRTGLRGDGVTEPYGIRNTSGVSLSDLAGAQVSYDNVSTAVETIMTANGEANAVIIAPRTWGYISRFKDGEGNPLTEPESWSKLTKLVSGQVPITVGTSSNKSEVYTGQFDTLVLGMRHEMILEISREAGDSWAKRQVWIRAYLRGDWAVTRPDHMYVHYNVA